MDDQSRSRTVILLRHGKSSWSDSTLADIDRPLAPRGERASRKLAKYMRRKRMQPALVLCPSRGEAGDRPISGSSTLHAASLNDSAVTR